jgi:dihydroorotate dehydrogenase (fumarate)
MAQELDRAGADALVLFNRFYQPDIDLLGLRMVKDLELSRRHEIRLPLLWIGVLSGNIGASLAASTGVESAEEVLKYLLAGADVVMTTSALLRHGVQHVATLLSGVSAWLSARDIQSLDQVRGLLSRRTTRATGALIRADYIEMLQEYDPQPVA